MKILSFGSCNIDFVYSLNHIVSAGETEQVSGMNTFPGGKGLNQSIALARAGAGVAHAGCIGTDGKMLSELMEENGIDISHISYVNERNGHAIIQVSGDAENSILVYPGSNAMITDGFIDSVLKDFGKGDIILLQNEINSVASIIEKAHAKGMCIVLNPSPCNEKINEIDLNLITYLILNEIEAEKLSGASDVEAITGYFRTKYPQLKIVLTLGKNGSVYFDINTKIFQPAFCVQAVDTTAAGDTFTGYFIAEIAEASDYKKALQIASAASAIAVSRNGAAPSIPHKNEVYDLMASMTEYQKSDFTSNILKNKTDAYIEENLKSASIRGLSERLGYSAAYTNTLIKKLYNKPFSKLIQDKRCCAAAKALKETDLSVGEIINSLGYENESFFRKLFKEKYGKNMLEYRKRG